MKSFKSNTITRRELLGTGLATTALASVGQLAPFIPIEAEAPSPQETFHYVHDDFLISSFNEFAACAAFGVVSHPGCYNPLIIQGESGLGKTKILQAAQAKLEKRGKAVFNWPAEKFLNVFIHSIRKSKMDSFREMTKNQDVFILEDSQVLTRGEAVQDELVDLIHHYLQSRKPLILSIDRPSGKKAQFSGRLENILAGGVTVKINRPSLAETKQIVNFWAQKNGLKLSENQVNFVASHSQNNPRRVLGNIARLKIWRELHGRPIDNSIMKELILNTQENPGK